MRLQKISIFYLVAFFALLSSIGNIWSGAPNGTKSHELYHTTGVLDNGYDKGGILNSPPQIITPEEVSLMWNLIPEKNEKDNNCFSSIFFKHRQ